MKPSRKLPRRRESGMVLVLTLVFAGVLILLAATLSRSARSQINIRNDEREALRAEMASEAAIEYARLQLARDPDWDGTGLEPVQMAGGSAFAVTIGAAQRLESGAADVPLRVTGLHGQAVHRFSSVVRVHPVPADAYTYALLVLGKNFAMAGGGVEGDVLFADRAHKVNDWMFDSAGSGYYLESNGPDADGVKLFTGTGVRGTLFKYRDDLPDYQWQGDEVVIQDNTWMPSWELDDYLEPGPGRVNLVNPHNLGAEVWRLENLTYNETVVVELTNKQTLQLTNCHFKGGLIVHCPEEYDVRTGGRNLVYLKKGTIIGGGADGVAPHVGLVAPGATLKTDRNPVSVAGFSMVNDVDLVHNADFTGQFVILNDAKGIANTTIRHDPEVTANLPPFLRYGSPTALTELVSLYEDFD